MHEGMLGKDLIMRFGLWFIIGESEITNTNYNNLE